MGKYVLRYYGKENSVHTSIFLSPLFASTFLGFDKGEEEEGGLNYMQIGKKGKGVEGESCLSAVKDSRRKERKTKINVGSAVCSTFVM